MPIFDFRCNSCGSIEEHFVFSASDTVSCKKCGFQDTTRLFTIRPAAKVMPAEGITLKNLPGGPKTFKSFVDMSKYANDNNLELGALL